MKNLLFVLAFVPAVCFSAGSSSLDFSFVSLRDLVSLYFAEVEKVPYTICDALLRDDKAVSLRASGQIDRAAITAALRSNGYDRWEESGVSVICRAEVRKIPNADPFVYRVKNRSVDYLVEQLSQLVTGKFSKSKAAGPEVNSSATDVLVFTGPSSDVAILRQVLPLLDVKARDVVVRAEIYEVGDSSSFESALNAVGSILGGRFAFDLGVSSAGASARVNIADFSLIGSLLDKDSRFRLVSRPSVRATSGSKASLSVGSEVPVSGATVANGQGQVTQNVVYRPSGVILTVSPVVRDEIISVDVTQVLSDFVRTESGLNYTPTLNKRELSSTFALKSGEVVVLAGLSSEKISGSGQSLFGFPLGVGRSGTAGQLLLFLQVEVI
jgi:type II secretory pathway component GspD/PulD (secretin)